MSDAQFLFLCVCGVVIVAHAVSDQIARAMPVLMALAFLLRNGGRDGSY